MRSISCLPLLALACTPPGATFLVSGDLVLVVRLPEGAPITVTGFTPAPTGALEIEVVEDENVHILEYDEDITDFIVMNTFGNVQLPPDNASPSERWSVPPPVRQSIYHGERAVEPSPLDGTGVQVLRPPCPQLVSEPIVDAAIADGVAMLLTLGDGALIGTWPATGSTMLAKVLYRGPSGRFDEIPGLAWTSTASPSPPFGFADEAGATVYGPMPGRPKYYGFYDVSPDRTVGAPRPIAPGLIYPPAFAGKRYGSERTIIARTPKLQKMLILDPMADQWLLGAEVRALVVCASELGPIILDITGPRTAIVALGDGRITQIDLMTGVQTEVEDLPQVPAAICNSGRLALPRGGELFMYSGPQPGLSLQWRRTPESPWTEIDHRNEQPSAFGLWGDRAVLALGRSLMLLDDEPRRPEHAPRMCGPYTVSATADLILPRGDELLVASTRVTAGFEAMSRVTIAP